MAPGPGPDGARLLTRPILGWALYDLANTIFAAGVITLFFPLYLTHVTGRALGVGMANTGSMLLAGLLVPICGGLTDATGRAKRYLLWVTLICVGATAALSVVTRPALLIGGFILANLAFQTSLVFYNTLLPVVAPPGREGIVSGLGVGLGYAGIPLALALLYPLAQTAGERFTFVGAAVLFLGFALPCFAWTPERRVSDPRPLTGRLAAAEFRAVLATIRRLPATPALAWFFVGNLLCVDAVNTAILWFAVYLERVFAFSLAQIIGTQIALATVAFAAAGGAGWLADRLGALSTLLLAAGGLAGAFAVAAVTTRPALLLAGLLLGGASGLAGIWTAGRALLLDLAPPAQAGRYFGLYGITTKVSAAGSLLFSVLADGFGYRVALGCQVLPLLLGGLALWRVRRHHRPR